MHVQLRLGDNITKPNLLYAAFQAPLFQYVASQGHAFHPEFNISQCKWPRLSEVH